jgi:hypothetical protein
MRIDLPRALTLGVALVLSGCAVYTYTLPPDRSGRTIYEIHCEASELAVCRREAERICPRGYDEIDTPADAAWRNMPDTWWGRFYIGKPHRRVITVGCR